MKLSWKRMIRWIIVGIALFILLVGINQLLTLYERLSIIHPMVGTIGVIIFGVGILGIMLVPIIAFLRLRKPLELPENREDAAYQSYLVQLSDRMAKNPHLQEKGFAIDHNQALEPQIDAANKILYTEAERITRSTAAKVFLSTAVSQNGSLDSIFVLYHLTKMVWKISKVYHQRSTLQRIFYLYTNIGATVLMAQELGDLDLLADQLEPAIRSMLGGSLGALVPGASALTTVLVNSIIQGSTNAFLTLRIGLMAANYSEATTHVNKKLIRKSATAAALVLLGKTVQEQSVSLIKSFAGATKRATVDKAVDTVKSGGNRIGDIVKGIFSSEQGRTQE